MPRPKKQPPPPPSVEHPLSLDVYFERYGQALGIQAAAACRPLHIPGRDEVHTPALLRPPFEAQAHVITAGAKALERQQAIQIAAECGTGKGGLPSTKVLTPTGWTTLGQIKVGDIIIDPEGGTTTVSGVFHRGVMPMFRVTFCDGASTVCSDDHLWLVSTPERRWRGHPGQVKRLSEIRGKYLGGCVRKDGSRNRRYFIPLVQPVHFKTQLLPLHPYLLGYILGNACLSTGNQVLISIPDEETVARLQQLVDHPVSLKRKGEYDYWATAPRGQGNPLLNHLRDLKLIGHRAETKFVPQTYLHSAVDQRRLLLMGLLDSDDCVANADGTGVEYCSASKQIASDVIELVRSLGGVATMSVKEEPSYVHKGETRIGQPSYRLYIALPEGEKPFQLTRKQMLYKPRTKYWPTRSIANVEPIGDHECICIAVASKDKLYVTDDYIVTHNSLISQAIIQAHAHGRGYRAAVFCPPHLVGKWEREIADTLENAHVHVIESYHDLTRVKRHAQAFGRGWWIISNTRAKMGAKWVPAFERYSGMLLCPRCCERIEHYDKVEDQWLPILEEKLHKKRHTCEKCGEQLWQWNHDIDRWPVAAYIHKKLPGWFQYLIIDECFPGETPVATRQGNVLIQDIRPGEHVLSQTESGLCYRRVVRKIAKQLRQPLVRVVHEHGSVVCTPNHKFYVEGRYIPASDLQSGDGLSVELRTVREAVQGSEGPAVLLSHLSRPNDGRIAAVETSTVCPLPEDIQSQPGIFSKVWLPQVLHGAQEAGQCSYLPSLQSALSRQGREQRLLQSPLLREEQTNTSRLPAVCEDFLLAQAYSEILPSELRAAHDNRYAAADCGAQGAGMAPTPIRVSIDGAALVVESLLPANRLSPPTGEGGYRNRRPESRQAREQIARQTQGVGTEEHGLDRAKVQEPGSRSGVAQSAGPNPQVCISEVIRVEAAEANCEWVYDLEVEDTHCYFAAGVLVSNCHQTKGQDTAIGQAAGSLSASCGKIITLTGTMLGGYAWHCRNQLFRIAPRSLIDEGLGWKDAAEFDSRYGRLEYKTVERENTGKDNRQSRGRTQSKTTKYVRPGVMPTLFGRHLIQNTIFLSLDEVADNLPPLAEDVLPVDMDPELAAAYKLVEEAITSHVKKMLAKKDKRLLSKMLYVLLGYPDHPWGWGEIGYRDIDETTGESQWVHVIDPPDLSPAAIRPKEQALIDAVKHEHDLGRQSWVYAVMTDKRDVCGRLGELLSGAGLRTQVLRSSIETGEREDWIAKHGPLSDCVVSHPQLVETGLDLFDKRGSYNFPTLEFYQTGYGLFTLRQASRRSWRIAQTLPCKVRYRYYAQTMQARAMTLMGKKLAASSAVEGKFSAEGLAAMAGDEGTLEMAMARSLVQKLGEDLDVGRAWNKLGSKPRPAKTPAVPAQSPAVPVKSQPAEEPDWLIPPAPKKPRREAARQPALF